MKYLLITAFLSVLLCAGCKSTDTVIPIGVSTYITKEDFKNQLGLEVSPISLAFSTDNNLYVADSYRIFKITSTGKISLFAGGTLAGYRNGSALMAMFNGIHGLAVDAQGNLFVGEQHNTCIRKITPAGQVSLWAGKPQWTFLPGFDGPDDGPDSSAHFAFPSALALDKQGNLVEAERGFISRFAAAAVRRITPSGYVKTLAGSVGNSTVGAFRDAPGYFSDPTGLAVGGSDTLYISDTGTGIISKVAANGQVTTLAGNSRRESFDGVGQQASFTYLTALVCNSAQTLYVGDRYKIRQINPDGRVKTIAGGDEFGQRDGSLLDARFGQILDLAFDSFGQLYVADPDNACIRRIRFD